MELCKEQFKQLLYNINWEISDPEGHLDEKKLKHILDKTLIDYEV